MPRRGRRARYSSCGPPDPPRAPADEGFDVVAGLGRALRDPLATITALASAGPSGDGLVSAADWEVARKGIVAEATRLEAVADQLALLATDGRAASAVAVRPERVDVRGRGHDRGGPPGGPFGPP